jgi:hypothetical protein
VRLRTTGLLLASALAASGCHFSLSGLLLPALVDGGTDDLAGDLGVDDLAMPPDLSGLCSPMGPQSACSADGMSLITCTGGAQVPKACADGCNSTGSPHCIGVDPSGVAAPTDYFAPGLTLDTSISGTATVNSDTGEIIAPPLTRAAGQGIDNNIGFRVATQSAGGPEVAIFSFRALTIASGAVVNVIGSRPVAFVALNDINVSGAIDVQGSCMPGTSVAGGGLGGLTNAAGLGGAGSGSGAGGGGFGTGNAGGGGGGGAYGEIGGTGTTVGGGTGGNAGALFGDLTATDPILMGGSGGGAGGAITNNNTGGRGGSGGGFVQLASNGQITLGAAAVIQAGGCHGSPGGATANGGGGGGGSGGAIMLEARTVTFSNGTVLAANGGAGGGGADGSAGADGPPDNTKAKAGTAGGNATDGGDGGHTTALAGHNAQNAGGGDKFGGGGGGGVGRIAIKTLTGTVTTSGAVLSPAIDEKNPGHAAPATVGMITLN